MLGLFLAVITLGLCHLAIVRAEETPCLTAYHPNGTTTAMRTNAEGRTQVTTIENPTTLFAPCGTEWTTYHETFTVLLAECDETHVRNEPHITRSGVLAPTKADCFFSITPPIPPPSTSTTVPGVPG
ncbi:hypothetical protein AX15_003141, partial [Amanita polypyramis BW_CC]